MKVYVVIEEQYDEDIAEPFRETLGVFSTRRKAQEEIEESPLYQAPRLPAGLEKVTYVIETYELDASFIYGD